MSMSASPYQPSHGINRANLHWWPYSSSYHLTPTSWANDGPGLSLSANGGRIVLNQERRQYEYGTSGKNYVYGGRKLDEISYCAQKVAVADSQQRHFDKTDMYFVFPEARQPLLFWDGSVLTRKTGNANKGWDPRDTRPKVVERFEYEPDLAFESPKPYGVKQDENIGVNGGYYKWTRGGLRGIDYGGAEISTIRW